MIEIAKTAGFCFGVSRAIKLVNEALDSGKRVCSFGNIIHNDGVNESLKNRGVRVVNCLGKIGNFDVLLIRSHGAGPEVYRYAKTSGIELVDASCPFVKRIHRIVEEADFCGRIVLIAGNCNHPEVLGIVKYFSNNRPHIFSDLSELKLLFKRNVFLRKKNLVVVAQTTFNEVIWKKCIEFIKKECENFKIFNTICSATSSRQNEAVRLAKKVDFMVVIGGKHSSNTRKLFDLCMEFCNTVLVENWHELSKLNIEKLPEKIGITAGASTPFEDVEKIHSFIKFKYFFS